jgi:hypothetical protein
LDILKDYTGPDVVGVRVGPGAADHPRSGQVYYVEKPGLLRLIRRVTLIILVGVHEETGLELFEVT